MAYRKKSRGRGRGRRSFKRRGKVRRRGTRPTRIGFRF